MTAPMRSSKDSAPMVSRRPRLPRECRRDVRMGGAPKRTYGTKAEAEENVGRGENAYECGACGFWHVGHKPGTKFGDKPGGRRMPR